MSEIDNRKVVADWKVVREGAFWAKYNEEIDKFVMSILKTLATTRSKDISERALRITELQGMIDGINHIKQLPDKVVTEASKKLD
jgi:hypothetical protein